MIRINLLPVRAAKKKESIRFQLTVAGLATFFVFAVSAAGYLIVRSEASSLTGQITAGNQELTDLKKKIGELSKIKEQKKIVEEKLRIINQLEADRTGPAKLFKGIADAIPARAWLKSMKDEDFQITLEGYASDDEVVAEFMRGLEKAAIGMAVELEVAQRLVEKESAIEVVNFIVRIEKQRPVRQEETPSKQQQKKKKKEKPAAKGKK
ncbi:MAG TPA: PilN domain-containing protein [Thermodesulfobacteriota bacterium]